MWEEQTVPNPAPANRPHSPPLTIHKQDTQKECAGAPPVCTGGRRKVRPHSLPFAPPTPLTREQGAGTGRAATPPFAEGAQKKGSPPSPPLSPSPHSHGEQDAPMNAHKVRPICAGGTERYAPLLPLSPTHTKIGRVNGLRRDPHPLHALSLVRKCSTQTGGGVCKTTLAHPSPRLPCRAVPAFYMPPVDAPLFATCTGGYSFPQRWVFAPKWGVMRGVRCKRCSPVHPLPPFLFLCSTALHPPLPPSMCTPDPRFPM